MALINEYKPEVLKSKSKKLVQPDTGEVLYYIEKNHGLQLGLSESMIFNRTYPLDSKYCEISLEINRVEVIEENK